MSGKEKAVNNLHPAALIVFYVAALTFGIIFMHPAVLLIAFAASVSTAFLIRGGEALKFLFAFCVPLALLVILINPIFNHRGLTKLFDFFGNPVTKEAFLYGALNAIMLVSALLWFFSFTFVMNSEKFIYLFGRIIPKTALILSMTLRFIPLFIRRVKTTAAARTMIGKGFKGGGIIPKIKYGLRILFIVITWSLENGVESADSMRARGYGLKGRTSFTLFKFKKTDCVFLLLLIVLSGCFASVIILNRLPYSFFPAAKFGAVLPLGALGLACFAALCFLPAAYELYYIFRCRRPLKKAEERLWL